MVYIIICECTFLPAACDHDLIFINATIRNGWNIFVCPRFFSLFFLVDDVAVLLLIIIHIAWSHTVYHLDISASLQNMNWSTILKKEIGKCIILNYTIIIVFKKCNGMHYMCISFISCRYHLKQYDQLKWMWKA